MSLPVYTNFETPILHELNAVGGKDDVRFLYERLISYFPQLNDSEIKLIKNSENISWRKLVQKAGKSLDGQNLIRREKGLWSLTEVGKSIIQAETSGIIVSEIKNESLSHQDIQEMICQIGQILGYFTAKEFDYFDVIWRENEKNQRISHVFEVQSKGNIDSAFAKLKRAFDAQRTKPFLVLSTERDTNRANRSLTYEFRELENVITVLSFAEIRKIHGNLTSISKFIPSFLDK